VPVLELARREIILGGAANPARNIVALGSHALQVGIIGADPEGEQLRAAFVQHHISPAGLVTVAGRPTTVKTRILAHEGPRLPQQVARLDRLDRATLPPADEQRILEVLQTHVPQVDAVLCSDYRTGLLSPTVVEQVRMLCQQHGKLLTVDAQGNADYYHGVDLFRCNDREAAATLGVPLDTEEEFRAGVVALRQRLAARLVIVTRGPEGASLEGEEIGYTHLPASSISEVYDTTGAGDTFIAVATLALAAQLGPHMAARLANAAAALVVQRLGNAVVLPEELAHIAGESGEETAQTEPE
jgi:rfaE bifunctional protein kinase chain/domain